MTGSILLARLPPAQKEHLVCRISHSIVLVWMVREEERVHDPCKAMGKGKELESNFLTGDQEQSMNKLNCKVVEPPVQRPVSSVASQAMLGSEEAGLCILGCQGSKDEPRRAGVISTISPEAVQCLRAGAGWGAPGCRGRDCRAGDERGWGCIMCCCSEQASGDTKEWETLPAQVTHFLPPHRAGWLLRSRQGDKRSARNPHPSGSGTGIEELL